MYAPWKTHISSNVYEVNGSLTTKTIIMSNLLMIIRTHQAQKQPQFGWGGSYEENEENEEYEEYEKNPITRSKVALREGFLQTSLDWWMDIDHWLWPETCLAHIGHSHTLSLFKQSLSSSQLLGSAVRHVCIKWEIPLAWYHLSDHLIFVSVIVIKITFTRKSSPPNSGICVKLAHMHHYHLIITIVKSRAVSVIVGVADAVQVSLHRLLSVTRQLGIIPRAPTYNLPHYSMYSPKCSQFRTYSDIHSGECSFAIIAGDSD